MNRRGTQARSEKNGGGPLSRRDWLGLAAVAGLSWASGTARAARDDPFEVGEFRKIYEPGPRDADGKPPKDWHINDHTFIRGEDGLWHVFGIAWTDPEVKRQATSGFLEHATSPELIGPEAKWERREPVMEVRGDRFETVMWAPHVIRHGGTYHMVVATGDPDPTNWGITHATSPDLGTWTRVGSGPLFRDGYHARDPMLMRHPDDEGWVLYYTATERPEGGHFVVAYRTSPDLVRWSERRIAYTDRQSGTFAGPTESPFVVRRGEEYYLFIAPRPYDPPTPELPNHLHPGYVGTDVFRSRDWRKWTDADLVGHVRAHAAELVEDDDGSWFISSCGVGQHGLYLAPFHWGVPEH